MINKIVASNLFNIDSFISEYVIKRKNSMFLEDFNSSRGSLIDGVFDSSVLVIGGAGSIGSTFVKAFAIQTFLSGSC